MINLNEDYWSSKYEAANTGWDTGGITTPLKTYFDQLADESLRILIPGCGNGYEAEYLHHLGFEVSVLDLSEHPLKNLRNRCPSFPLKNLIQGNFFDSKTMGLNGQFDLIIEQTFFSALNPGLRKDYAKQMHALLKTKGKLVGLLFNIELYHNHPPFGGNASMYKPIFEPYFEFKVFEEAYNSIEPRKGNELFINLVKK